MAETACLENMWARKGLVGSNPTLSETDTNSNLCALRLRVQGFEFWYVRHNRNFILALIGRGGF